MVTAESKINLPPENSRAYKFSKELDLKIGYNAPITKDEYESRFGGNER